MKTKVTPHQTVLRGIVIPVDWDENGNVIALAVSTHDEDEYLVQKDKNWKALLPFLRKQVEVSGLVGMKKNQKSIKVISLREVINP